MEEKEVITSGQEKNDGQEGRKLTYNELMGVINQLKQYSQDLTRQNEALEAELRQRDGVDARMFYLFKILENRAAFETEFVINVTDEIVEIMNGMREAVEKTPDENTKEG